MVIASQCDFCISSGSGYDGLVRSFRKPVLFTNFLPASHFVSQSKYNMSIFKHVVNEMEEYPRPRFFLASS